MRIIHGHVSKKQDTAPKATPFRILELRVFKRDDANARFDISTKPISTKKLAKYFDFK